jgi:hypothetical protein
MAPTGQFANQRSVAMAQVLEHVDWLVRIEFVTFDGFNEAAPRKRRTYRHV